MNNEKLKLVIGIVERGLGKKLIDCPLVKGIQIINLGKGTACSDVLNCLGIGEEEKDVVFTFAYTTEAHMILEIWDKKMNFKTPNSGIAFTISINSIFGISALNELLGKKGEQNE